MGEWLEIPQDQELNIGDRCRLYFSCVGPQWIGQKQIDAALDKLAKQEKPFRVIDHNIIADGWLIDFYIEVEVIESKSVGISNELTSSLVIAGITITAAVIAKIIAAAFALWLTFKLVTLYVTQKTADAAVKTSEAAVKSEEFVRELGITTTKIAMAAVILLLVWRNK